MKKKNVMRKYMCTAFNSFLAKGKLYLYVHVICIFILILICLSVSVYVRIISSGGVAKCPLCKDKWSHALPVSSAAVARSSDTESKTAACSGGNTTTPRYCSKL